MQILRGSLLKLLVGLAQPYIQIRFQIVSQERVTPVGDHLASVAYERRNIHHFELATTNRLSHPLAA